MPGFLRKVFGYYQTCRNKKALARGGEIMLEDMQTVIERMRKGETWEEIASPQHTLHMR